MISKDSIRILVADDDSSVLDTYQSILAPPPTEAARQFSDLSAMGDSLFGATNDAPVSSSSAPPTYELLRCRQGDEALKTVTTALDEQRPFAIAFLDVRMPPGPDGIWTAERIRKIDPHIELVMVTGYSDLHPEEISHRVPPLHKLLYIQKPFHPQEITQFATALGKKWQTERELLSAHNRLLETNEDLQSEIEARQKAEAQYRLVLESSPDPVVVYDMQGGVTYLNPAFSKVFGWTLDEIRGQPLEFVPPEHISESKLVFSMIRQGETIFGVESARFTKKGDRLDVGISGAGFFDEQGRLQGSILTIQDITERKKTEEEIRFIAYHDVLTGLPNRKSFYMRLEEELVASDCRLQSDRRRSGGKKWALLFLDLDKFKDINDTLGHDAGDEILQIAGKRLRSCLRKSDYLFRLGGDEFTIILRNLIDDSDAAIVAKKVREAVSRPCRVKGHDICVNTSIGISVHPKDGDNVEKLVKNADMAMYAAKDTGKGYLYYTEAMNRAVLERMKMESCLQSALHDNQFAIYYQQLVDKTQRIVGAEALLRWLHPEMGLISPGKFIPIAEETGDIVSIGKWVLHTACAHTKRWHDIGYKEFYVAVNLSPRQFKEPDLVETVEQALRDTGLPPRCLRLEVTESSIMENPEQASQKMQDLREIGVRFAIDDFGTGYSSLSCLKQFPVDVLKIDRSFVKNSLTNKDDQEIIKTIIAMARNLNMTTVAEGVETKELHKLLIRLGCQKIQGYYHGRPVPVEDFEVVLCAEDPPRKQKE
ncbi:MAG: EAL domain-containing protein [Desulfobacteraceae bacterium]|nr:EAL domain-containing protein [Desulfobacteraceae bacterium]